MNYAVIIVIIGHRGHGVLNIREGETGFLRQFLHHCRDLVKKAGFWLVRALHDQWARRY